MKQTDTMSEANGAQNLFHRIGRHFRLVWQNLAVLDVPSPPFLILFINSTCNMKCEHCFYWRELNEKDDLTFAELVALSEDLGHIENLNLSGGEPFLREDLAAVCSQFVRRNGVSEIYIPTNGYFTDRTVRQIRDLFDEEGYKLLVVELSLDGMPEFHDAFRKTKNAFRKAMETYHALAALRHEDPRLQIHGISTATATNMGQIRELTTFLFDRCPEMSHHNLAIIRGDRKDPSLRGPELAQYEDLAVYVRRLWAPREEGRYGGIVEPMLQWAKVKTARQRRQVVPCRAGVLSAVVYANGDVAMCESLAPLGNIRDRPFGDIWRGPEARRLRASIAAKQCHCTNEIFMWPSITFQPLQLLRAMIGAKVWRRDAPLDEAERSD